MNDIKYMELAKALALRGKGKTSPNPMVGALVVKAGRIVGRGWHKRCGSAHAEVLALRQAGKRTRGATLFVTLEPCAHFGRTPPCVDAVIRSGIRAAVIGQRDPNLLTNGRSIRKMRRAGIKVKVGVMEKELRQMNEAFVKHVTRKMPFVTAKVAQTLDGKIATASGQSKWITSLETRTFTRRLRNDFDAIMVGINTLRKDDPCLCPANKSKRLKRIVLDSRLSVSLNAKIIRQNSRDCIFATTNKASGPKIRALQKRGVEVIVTPARNKRVDLRWLLKELARREIANILLEGGGTVIGEALRLQLIDKFHIFIAPKIMGDVDGQCAVRGARCSDINRCVPLKDMRIQRVGSDIFVEATPVYC